jgi:hypothetical protein
MEQRPWQLGQHHKQHPANSTQKQHLACEQHPAVAAFFVNQTVFLVNQDFFFENQNVFFGNQAIRKLSPYFSETKFFGNQNLFFRNQKVFFGNQVQKLKTVFRIPKSILQKPTSSETKMVFFRN